MPGTHYPNITQDGFTLDVRQWRTVAEFRAHLAGYDYQATAPWARGCLVHHTVSPTAAGWNGTASMAALARYYRAVKGWSTGPHLFVVSGCPTPSEAGIWQLTPLSEVGVHGNAANSWAWGVEVVGLYDRAPWPPDVAGLALGAMGALLDWASLKASAATLQPHSRYNSQKSCPGSAIDMAAVVRGVAALQQPQAPAPLPAPPRSYSEHSLIIAPPGLSRDALAGAFMRRCERSPYPLAQRAGLADAFYDLGMVSGVDPVVAAAQCCHETGNLTSQRSQPPQHNTAGIGATNDGAQGAFFPSLEASARAQMGRLIAYAVPPALRTSAQSALVAIAMDVKPLPAECHGSAVALYQLGEAPNLVPGCGWAKPGDEYGLRIANVANALVRLA